MVRETADWHKNKGLGGENFGTQAREQADRLMGKADPRRDPQQAQASLPAESLGNLGFLSPSAPASAPTRLPETIIDKSNLALLSAVEHQRQQAKIFSQGKYAWASEFFGEGESLPRSNDLKSIDLAGAEELRIFSGLPIQSENDGDVKQWMAYGTDKLLTSTNDLVRNIEDKQKREGGAQYDAILGEARKAAEAASKLERERLRIETEYQRSLDGLATRSEEAEWNTLELSLDEQEKARERLNQERRELNERYRADMYALLDQARDATQNYKVAEAKRNLADAELTGDVDKIADAQYALRQQVEMRNLTKDAGTSAAADSKNAAQYQADIKAGEAARQALRAQKIDEFVAGVTPQIQEEYKQKISAARLKFSTSPDQADEAVKDLEQQRNALLKRLADKGKDEQLASQMEFITERLNNNEPPLSEAGIKDARSRMIVAAAEYKGDSRDFASHFFSNDLDLAATMAPVKIGGLQGTLITRDKNGDKNAGMVSINPKDVAEIKIVGQGENAYVEVMTRGGRGNFIRVTGSAAEKMIKNGLDLSDTTGAVLVTVDMSTGIGYEGRKLVLLGTNGHDIRLNSSGGIQLGTLDVNPEGRANMFAAVQSVGDSDPSIAERAGRSMLNARIAAAKKQHSSGKYMMARLDVDNDGRLSGDELALLDANGDNQLDKRELAAISGALSGIQGAGLKQLQDLNKGTLTAIDIATLGDVMLPSARGKPDQQLAQNNVSPVRPRR